MIKATDNVTTRIMAQGRSFEVYVEEDLDPTTVILLEDSVGGITTWVWVTPSEEVDTLLGEDEDHLCKELLATLLSKKVAGGGILLGLGCRKICMTLAADLAVQINVDFNSLN